MKKTLSILLTSLLLFGLLLAFAGCQSTTPTPSPTPMASPSPKATVAPATSASPGAVPSSSPDESPAGGASGTNTIEGFEEGKTLKPEDAPDVVKAIKDKFPNATIKTITYETHMAQQMYRVVLEKAEDGGTDFYVSPDGTVTPYTAAASAAPKE